MRVWADLDSEPGKKFRTDSVASIDEMDRSTWGGACGLALRCSRVVDRL